MKKYSKLKEEIQRRNNAKVKEITKEQQEELLEHRRKEDKENFFTGCQCHVKYGKPSSYDDFYD